MHSRDSRDGQLARNPDNTQTGPGGFVVDGKMQAFEAGDVIGGSYEIIEQLGRGAMGMVFKARHTTMGTVYALKLMAAEQLTDVGVRRFQNEAQAIAKLNHPNVIRIYNFGLHLGQLPFYVMDLLQGENLLDKVIEYGPVPVPHCMPIFIEACAGLGYAHRKGILHRDVKPANLVLLDAPDVQGARVKVVDFGIVKFAEEVANAQKLTAMGDVCGSPTYMSPEQAAGAKVDPRSDIYSLGVSLYECLTGNLPFRGRNPMETMMMHHTTPAPSLKANGQGRVFPDTLEYVVAKTLQKEPMDRYQTMDALAQDLKNVLLGAPIGTQQNLGEIFGHSSSGGPQGSAMARDIDPRTNPASATGTSTNTPNVRSTSAPASSAADEIALRFNNRASARFERDSAGTLKGREDEDYDYDAPPAGFNAIKLVVIPLVAVTLLGGLAYFIHTAMSPRQAPTPVVEKVRDTTKEFSDTIGVVKTLVADPQKIELPSAKYFSTIDKANREIVFKFPGAKDDSKMVAYVGEPFNTIFPCTGIRKFPLGAKINLYPAISAEANPDFFLKFRPGEIYEVGFNFPADTDKSFAAVTQVHGFTKLKFNNCNQFTSAILVPMNKLTTIKEFEVTGGQLDGAFYARISWLDNLNLLGMNEITNITPLLAKVAHMNKLEKLYLQRCKLSHGDFLLLAKNNSLKTLSLFSDKISQDQLEVLSAMHGLKVLDIAGNKMGVEVAPIIRKFGSINKLIIDRDNFNFRPANEAFKKWKDALPGVEIKIK